MSYTLLGQNNGKLYMVDTYKPQYNLSLHARLAHFLKIFLFLIVYS
jgi:hypothetical protein